MSAKFEIAKSIRSVSEHINIYLYKYVQIDEKEWL